MVAHDVFGFSLDQVQHILHDYREQVPHAEALLNRLRGEKNSRMILVDLLKRIDEYFTRYPVLWTDVKAVALVSDLGLIAELFQGESKTGGSSGVSGAP